MKEHWQIVARDFNSPFIRNFIISSCFLNYPKYLSIPSLLCGVVSQEDQIGYLYKPANWIKCHEAIKARVLKDPQLLRILIDKTLKWGQNMNRWSTKAIFRADLVKATDSHLVSLLREFYKRQAIGYTYGTGVALLDFQDFSFVDGSLKYFLRTKTKKEDFEKYYQLLTTPLKDSFGQEQERALLSLMDKYYRKINWVRDVKNRPLDYLKGRYPSFYADLKRHSQKYSWVYYVYKGPEFKPEQFLEFIREYLLKGVNPGKKLAQMKKEQALLPLKRRKIISELKPNQFELFIINCAPLLIWAKPRRKDYQSRSYFHVYKLLSEIARRLSISLNQARCLHPDALERALLRKKVNLRTLNEISRVHVCYPFGKTVRVLSGHSAEEFIKKIKLEKPKNVSMKEISATTAYPGFAKGAVRIIYRPEDMHKMRRGDILVSNATTPSIIQAMKMAGAIITDEGGLTCHAAIVSRELKVPCVIGAKIATTVLKDGDLVAVDATKGVIKKI